MRAAALAAAFAAAALLPGSPLGVGVPLVALLAAHEPWSSFNLFRRRARDFLDD
jgi:hypothetical protein